MKNHRMESVIRQDKTDREERHTTLTQQGRDQCANHDMASTDATQQDK